MLPLRNIAETSKSMYQGTKETTGIKCTITFLRGAKKIEGENVWRKMFVFGAARVVGKSTGQNIRAEIVRFFF